MTLFNRRPLSRWLVPLLAAVVLLAGGSLLGAITASAQGGLPQRSAAQLLVDVQKARLGGLSGTVVQNADLGLPSIPGVSDSSSSDLTSMVSGSHTLRIWYAGPSHVRLALLGSLGESDVVRNGTDLWTWSSAGNSATHRTLEAGAAPTPRTLADASGVSPQQAADAALAAIGPTTKVTTDGTAMVADRRAYELVLRPKDTRSLVGSVRIAIDGKAHVPTRVQVFAKGATKPSFEVGFTSFDPSTPSSSVFGFRPPPGTKVTQGDDDSGRQGMTPTKPGGLAPSEPKVVGDGWTAVAVATLPTDATKQLGPFQGMVDKLPSASGTWGSGHVLRGTLFSAVLTDDGRVAIGAVPPDLLYAALAR
jgi:outer membrane lipoprotein-sorting protein